MDIAFFCSNCGQHIVIDEAGALRLVDCPKCGASLEVPYKSQPLDKAPLKKKLCPDCGQMLPASALTCDCGWYSSKPETKKCPFCAETIKQAAKVCRFCGRDVAQSTLGQPPLPTMQVLGRSSVKDGVRIGVGIWLASLIIAVFFAAFAALIYLVVSGLAVPGFLPARKQSQGRRIINDARQMDAAIDQWALEKGKGDGNAVVTSEAAFYLKEPWPAADVLGNAYTIGTVGSNQVQISAATKTALDGVGIDWGPY